MHRDRRRETGRMGEKVAAEYLQNKGYRILVTNWRNQLGELDLVTEKEGQLVIVEVRTTRGSRYGFGFQSIDRKKQQQVRKVTLSYLQQNHQGSVPFRIDVISVLLDASGKPARIDHLEGVI